MRARYPQGLAVLLLASGCGGLSNQPLQQGEIRGQVRDVDPAVGRVSVLGHPDLLAQLPASGSFDLIGVPAGAQELLIVASSTSTLRVAAPVEGGRITDLGLLAGEAPGYFDVTLVPPAGRTPDGGEVSIEGTPIEEVAVDANGQASLGPLPAGCYTVKGNLPDLAEQTADACVATGERAGVTLTFPPPDGLESSGP